MRKLILVVAALALACGDDSGGSKDTQRPTGTIGGRAFEAAEVRAIVAGTGTSPCQLPLGGATLDIGLKAVELAITSYAGVCADVESGQCPFHQNAQSVVVLLAKLDPTGAEPALAKGTYTVQTSAQIPIPDDTGLLTVAYAQAVATDASCVGSWSPSVQGGTVRLDETAGPVKGHLSLTFQDGSTLQGDFSAPLCATSPDVCALATAEQLCTAPPVCVP